MSNTRIGAGAGLSLGAILALPAAAQADDFTVTNLNDDGAGSLREAVEDANDNPGADRVLFRSKLSGTIALTSFEGLSIYDDLEVLGPGARQLAVTKGGGGSILVPLTPSSDPGPVDVTVSGLALTGNTSVFNGGAIAAYGDYGTLDLTLSRVTIADNAATGAFAEDGDGGGLSASGDINLTVDSSTFTGNEASEAGPTQGGGMSLSGVDATVRNSTVSGNVSQRAGGIWSFESQLEMRNSTVARNTALAGYAGGFWLYDGTVDFRGTIVAENVAPDFATDVFSEGGVDLSAAFTLIGDATNVGIDDDLGGNLLGVDPKLKPLANNGGPTDTHAIKKSPAKNAGPSDAPDKDQRGAPRKGQADIGAYEFTKCKGVVVNRVGTSGKDKLKGTKKKDGMLGLGGNDKLKGKKGKDGLCGGRGKDKLIGGPGKDKLNGGPGKDKEVQ